MRRMTKSSTESALRRTTSSSDSSPLAGRCLQEKGLAQEKQPHFCREAPRGEGRRSQRASPPGGHEAVQAVQSAHVRASKQTTTKQGTLPQPLPAEPASPAHPPSCRCCGRHAAASRRCCWARRGPPEAGLARHRRSPAARPGASPIGAAAARRAEAAGNLAGRSRRGPPGWTAGCRPRRLQCFAPRCSARRWRDPHPSPCRPAGAATRPCLPGCLGAHRRRQGACQRLPRRLPPPAAVPASSASRPRQRCGRCPTSFAGPSPCPDRCCTVPRWAQPAPAAAAAARAQCLAAGALAQRLQAPRMAPAAAPAHAALLKSQAGLFASPHAWLEQAQQAIATDGCRTRTAAAQLLRMVVLLTTPLAIPVLLCTQREQR